MGLSQSSFEGQEIPSLSNVLDTENIDWNVVRQILQHEPEQACMYAHGGVEDSQLHVALKKSAPLDVVRVFVDAYEDALDQMSTDGSSVLHIARNDPETVDFLLRLRPSLAQASDRRGRLALHDCRNAQAAGCMIKAYPQGLMQRSRGSGNLPLHHALLVEEEEVEAELLKTFSSKQQSITSRNKRGQTPLQLLIRKLEQEATSTSTSDDHHQLWNVLLHWVRSLEPNLIELHALIEHGCCRTERLMRRALQDFEGQARQRDANGRTPMHVAASSGSCTTEALEVLLVSNPAGARMTDKEGRLPIDVAAESPNTQLHSLAVFMKGEPRAIDTRDLRDGNYPFVSAALGQQTSINSTYFLLRAKPHVLSYFHLP
jgi:ankyrin repeat protein